MANIYDEFTLENVRGIQAAINRAGATKAAIAQDAFLNQRAVQQAEQERRARNAAAIDLFRMEQPLRDASADKTRKAQTLEAIHVFNIEQTAREKSQIDAEGRRAKREVEAIGETAEAIEKAQDKILAAKEPEIRASWERIEEERAAENAQIEMATAAIEITPKQITARFLASQEGQAEISKLSAEQQALIRGGQVATVIQKLGPKKSGGLARVLDEARNQLEADAIDRRKQLVDVMQDQIKARPFNSDAQARMLMTRYPGAEKFRPQRLAPAESQESNEKKAGLPKRAVGALSPEETGFFPELYGGKQAGVATPSSTPSLPWDLSTLMFNKSKAIPSIGAQAMSRLVYGTAPAVAPTATSAPQVASAGLDPNQRAAAMFRLQSMLGGSAPAAAAAPAVAQGDPNQTAAAMFRLQQLLQGMAPTPSISPWQSGAEAFMVDPRMQGVNPFAPQVATEIPEAYFSVGR